MNKNELASSLSHLGITVSNLSKMSDAELNELSRLIECKNGVTHIKARLNIGATGIRLGSVFIPY